LIKYFEVITCENDKILWRTLAYKHVHLVLLEIGPEDTELEILQRIVKFNKELPVIVFGKEKKMETVAEAFEIGAQDFFRIPYKRNLLVERVIYLTSFVS